MMKHLLLAAMGLALSMISTTQAQVTITTSADTYLSNDGTTGPTVTHGAEEFMELRLQLAVNNQRAHIGYFQFDLSGVTGDLTGATLTFQVINSTRTDTINIFGVVDGASAGQGENWNEATISYSDATGFAPAAAGTYAATADLTAALASLNIGNNSLGDHTTTPNGSMDAFLAADSNGLVTFAAIYPGPSGNAIYQISTRENKDMGEALAARLYLPNATAVPEPATWATLLGVLSFLLACLRRRRP